MSRRITTAVLCVSIGLAAAWSVGEMASGQSRVVIPPPVPASVPGPVPETDPALVIPPPVPVSVPVSMKRPPDLPPDQLKAAQRAAADAASAVEEDMRAAGAGGMRGAGRSRDTMVPYGGDTYERSMTGEGFGYVGHPPSGRLYGDVMPIGARSFTPWANSPDPQMIELLKQDRAMEKQGRFLAQKCLASQGVDRETLRKELQELTTKHFELRQKRRQMEIESLEKQLGRVKATLDKRNNGKDLIIQRRIAKLLGEEDELAF